MKTVLMFPNNYIHADELERDCKLTIASVKRENLQLGGGAKKTSIIIYFEETARKAKANDIDEKRFVMNKTNMKIIRAMHGKDSDLWIGKQITLYATTCKMKGKTVDCIRVREGVK